MQQTSARRILEKIRLKCMEILNDTYELFCVIVSNENWSSSVTIVTRLGRPGCPDGLWSPPSLLLNGYRGIFPWG